MNQSACFGLLRCLGGHPLSRNAGHAHARQRLRPMAGPHFHEDGVPLETVETALLLGSLRRLIRPADAPRLSPIRSLAYFRPVIEELCEHPAPENYLEYLRLKLRQAAKTLSADDRKNTFSDDR